MVLKQFFRCICIVYYIYIVHTYLSLYISISLYLYIVIFLYLYIFISIYRYLSISIYIYAISRISTIYLSIYLSTFLSYPILSYFPQRPVETWPPQVLHRRDGRSPALRGRLLGAAAAAAGAVEARLGGEPRMARRSCPKDSPKQRAEFDGLWWI